MLEMKNMICRNETVCAVKMGDEISMLDVNSGKYFVLNSIGAVIWDLLQAPKSISEIADELMKSFEVDKENCEASVLKYLEDMKQNNLIEIQ